MVAQTFNLTVARPISCSISAHTNAFGGAAPVNVLTLQPGEVGGLAAGATTGMIRFDMGAAATIRQVGVLYTNSLVGTTCRIRASATTDFDTSPLFDSGATAIGAQGMKRPSGYRHFLYHHLAGSVSARYVQLDFVTNGATPFQIGRVFLGDVVQLEYNPDYGGTSWGYAEADEGDMLESGVEVLTEKTPAPELNFTAGWVTQAEMDADWEELGRLQWEATPVLVVRRPDIHDARHNGIYYGRLRMQPTVAAEFDMYEVQGRIRSLI